MINYGRREVAPFGLTLMTHSVIKWRLEPARHDTLIKDGPYDVIHLL